MNLTKHDIAKLPAEAFVSRLDLLHAIPLHLGVSVDAETADRILADYIDGRVKRTE